MAHSEPIDWYTAQDEGERIAPQPKAARPATKEDGLSYEMWFKIADGYFTAAYGISLSDLPDRMYRDYYEENLTPKEMLQEEFPDGLTAADL